MKIGRRVTLRALRWSGDPPEPGDFLVTRGGSAYLVDDVRSGRTAPPYRLDCFKVDPAEIPPGARAVVWEWSPRRRAA